MRISYASIILLATALLIAGALYKDVPDELNPSGISLNFEQQRDTPGRRNTLSVTPGVERWYTNTERQFSFRLPDGFFAPDIAMGTPNVFGVRVYNADGVELFVHAYPLAAGQRLNEEVILGSLSGVEVTNIKERVVSAFIPAYEFRTASLEQNRTEDVLWAAYSGYLFEVVTSVENRELFEFVVNSLQFAPPSPSAP